MPAFNILEFIPTHFCRCARSIVVLHMALFEVVLETRLKKKKKWSPLGLIKSEDCPTMGLKMVLGSLPPVC